MKKILLLAVSLFLMPTLSWADSNHFYLDNPIDGIYTMMDKVTKVAANYVKPVRKVETNEYVYCVTPGIAINPDGNYEKITSNPWNTLNISKEKYNKLQIISYYGYQYGNHSDLKWYAVTQYLIWQEVLPDGWSVYFTNTLRGPKTSDFDWMINELKSLVNSYYNNPSFGNELIGNYKDTTTIYDQNNVLHNYKSASDNVQITGNNLIIKPSNNDFTIKLDYITDNKTSNLYIYDNAQWVISKGSLPTRSINYQVFIPKGDLKIIKTIGNIEELDIKYNPKLSGVKYHIFNDYYDNTFMTDDNGFIEIPYLNIDNYYIKEVEAPTGFKIDNNIYRINIIPNKLNTITLQDNLLISRVNILKKYLDQELNLYVPEKNAVFKILNNQDESLVEKSTDEDGFVSFALPNGIYTVSQVKGIDNYDLIKNEEIEVLGEPIDLLYYNRPIFLDPSIIEEENIPAEIELEKPEISKEHEKNNFNDQSEQVVEEEKLVNEKTLQNTDLKIPQTLDTLETNLLNLTISFIIFIVFFLKKLFKKKEIR